MNIPNQERQYGEPFSALNTSEWGQPVAEPWVKYGVRSPKSIWLRPRNTPPPPPHEGDKWSFFIKDDIGYGLLWSYSF